MKKLFFISTIATAFILSSCTNDDATSTSEALVDNLDLDSEAALESNYEDVDQITEAGLDFIETGGRVARDIFLDCAEITHDEENKIVTIDYGTDGCEGEGGRIRRGIIRIEYNERRLVPEAYRIVTFDNFSVDDVQVEGTRMVENTSASLDDNVQFTSSLTGGKLTFADETTATRDANHTRTWKRALNPLNDETTVTGGASGTRRDGLNYTVEILEELVYKRDCRASRVFIPVSGIKQITTDNNVFVIDYGNGECDHEVTVTINGETFTRTIR